MIITSFFTILSFRIACRASSSLSNTFAGPRWLTAPPRPDVFSTAPSGARLPRRMTNGPSARMGAETDGPPADRPAAPRHRSCLGNRTTAHGHAAAIKQPLVQQHLHNQRDAADDIEIFHDVFAGRLEVHTKSACGAICGGSRLWSAHIDGVGQRHQMKDGVG